MVVGAIAGPTRDATKPAAYLAQRPAGGKASRLSCISMALVDGVRPSLRRPAEESMQAHMDPARHGNGATVDDCIYEVLGIGRRVGGDVSASPHGHDLAVHDALYLAEAAGRRAVLALGGLIPPQPILDDPAHRLGVVGGGRGDGRIRH